MPAACSLTALSNARSMTCRYESDAALPWYRITALVVGVLFMCGGLVAATGAIGPTYVSAGWAGVGGGFVLLCLGLCSCHRHPQEESHQSSNTSVVANAQETTDIASVSRFNEEILALDLDQPGSLSRIMQKIRWAGNGNEQAFDIRINLLAGRLCALRPQQVRDLCQRDTLTNVEQWHIYKACVQEHIPKREGAHAQETVDPTHTLPAARKICDYLRFMQSLHLSENSIEMRQHHDIQNRVYAWIDVLITNKCYVAAETMIQEAPECGDYARDPYYAKLIEAAIADQSDASEIAIRCLGYMQEGVTRLEVSVLMMDKYIHHVWSTRPFNVQPWICRMNMIAKQEPDVWVEIIIEKNKEQKLSDLEAFLNFIPSGNREYDNFKKKVCLTFTELAHELPPDFLEKPVTHLGWLNGDRKDRTAYLQALYDARGWPSGSPWQQWLATYGIKARD